MGSAIVVALDVPVIPTCCQISSPPHIPLSELDQFALDFTGRCHWRHAAGQLIAPPRPLQLTVPPQHRQLTALPRHRHWQLASPPRHRQLTALPASTALPRGPDSTAPASYAIRNECRSGRRVIKTINSLKHTKRMYRFKVLSERRHLKISSPN